MERLLLLKQPAIFGVIVPLAALAAASALLLFWVLLSAKKKSRRNQKDYYETSAAEQKRRVVEAASHRQQQQRQQQQQQQQQQKLKQKKGHKEVSKQTKHTAEKEQEASKIRKATLGDDVAWKEERASQDQFGFSIYGHTVDNDSCCCTKPSTRSKAISSSTSVPTGFSAIQGVSEIEGKADSQSARDVLLRLSREFEPVVSARRWAVQNLVELCFCNDTKPENVGGYCVSTGNGRTARSIHIRLRPSCRATHFFPYAQLVKVMAHELAHIVIGPHNDAFFRLMAEIEQEYADAQFDNNTPVSSGSFPLTAGRRLGTGNNNLSSPVLGSKELKESVANAAMKRSKAFRHRKDENEQRHKKTA